MEKLRKNDNTVDKKFSKTKSAKIRQSSGLFGAFLTNIYFLTRKINWVFHQKSKLVSLNSVK